MCQYGNPVTLPPTETVVLCESPSATWLQAPARFKKTPSRRPAHSLRLRLFSNSDMAVFSPFSLFFSLLTQPALVCCGACARIEYQFSN